MKSKVIYMALGAVLCGGVTFFVMKFGSNWFSSSPPIVQIEDTLQPEVATPDVKEVKNPRGKPTKKTDLESPTVQNETPPQNERISEEIEVIKETEKPIQVPEETSSSQTHTPVSETKVEETPISQPLPEKEKPVKDTVKPVPTKVSKVKSSDRIDFVYPDGSIYVGGMKNGKPHGEGKLVYSSKQQISSRDPNKNIAEVGDYIKGYFHNGEPYLVELCDKSNKVKVTKIIIPKLIDHGVGFSN